MWLLRGWNHVSSVAQRMFITAMVRFYPPIRRGRNNIMTVSAISNRVDYDGDDAVVAFGFSFPIIDTSDLKVYVRTTATGAEVLQAETTDYVVSATNNDYSTGGTVTMVVAPAATETLTIVRAMPVTQVSTFEDSKVLRVAALEAAVDKLTMLVQDLIEIVDRCVKAPVTDAVSLTYEAGNSVARASTSVIWDADGNLDES